MSHKISYNDSYDVIPAGLQQGLQHSLRELLTQGRSRNTTRSYESAMHYWRGWCKFRLGQELKIPLALEIVLQFIVDHVPRLDRNNQIRADLPPDVEASLIKEGYKTKSGAPSMNTLMHRLSVMSQAHLSKQLPSPCHDIRVRQLLSSARVLAARQGQLPQKKDAITKERLQALLETCDESFIGVRDRAMLLFAWSSGGRRCSEVVTAQMEFLHRLEPARFTYNLVYSKTNQTGRADPNSHKPVIGQAGRALEQWLEMSGIQEGAIFRRIYKGRGATPERIQAADALSTRAMHHMLRQRCALAGLEGFSPHSLRSGFITEAARRGVPLAETMALTGHKSAAVAMSYYRAEMPVLSPGASLMDDD